MHGVVPLSGLLGVPAWGLIECTFVDRVVCRLLDRPVWGVRRVGRFGGSLGCPTLGTQQSRLVWRLVAGVRVARRRQLLRVYLALAQVWRCWAFALGPSSFCLLAVVRAAHRCQ